MRIVSVLLWTMCSLSAYEVPGAERPNIVILLADDLGYGELGCQGNPQIPTPHIDSIAESGVRFTQAYVTGPNCSPSRAGLLTGKIPTRFGYEFNPIGARNEDPAIGLPAAEQTLAELLHDHGYTTGLVGKWHLGGAAAYHPLRHGFDEFFGFTHEGHYFTPPPHQAVTTMLRRKRLPNGEQGRWRGTNLLYSTHMGHDEPPYDANNPILRQGQPVDEPAYLTDAFAREAVSFIERHQELPFFLLVFFNAVHSPLQAKNSDLQKFRSIEDDHRRIFAGMLTALDDAVGQILNTLEATGTARNTWLVFLSDNGGPTRELTSSNLPLRGEKGSMYEGALRVPFMMKWPNRLPVGQVYTQPISSADLFATAATMAEAQFEHSIDGRDLIPFVTGQATGQPHTEFFWRQGERSALRNNDWKIIRSARNGKVQWELYDLAQDLSETNDLSAVNPAQLTWMQSRWQAFNAQMREPLF